MLRSPRQKSKNNFWNYIQINLLKTLLLPTKFNGENTEMIGKFSFCTLSYIIRYHNSLYKRQKRSKRKLRTSKHFTRSVKRFWKMRIYKYLFFFEIYFPKVNVVSKINLSNEWLKISFRVTKGSILGPILFNIFLADVFYHRWYRHSKLCRI